MRGSGDPSGSSGQSKANLKKRIPTHVCPDSCVQVSVGSEKNLRYDMTTLSVPHVEEERDISENLHIHTHIFTSHQQISYCSTGLCASRFHRSTDRATHSFLFNANVDANRSVLSDAVECVARNVIIVDLFSFSLPMNERIGSARPRTRR